MQCFTEQLSPNSPATLTAYLLDSSPEMPNVSARPAVLVLPGGGYMMCSDREGEPIALSFVAKGYHTFILRYSVGKEFQFDDCLADAVAALRRIRAMSAEWGILPQKIAVCGFSAGGHLAAAVSVMGEERPNAAILCYPCILDSTSPILAFPVPSCTDYVDDRTPPTFLFHTASDTNVAVENSLQYAAALNQHHIPFALHIFPNGVHGLSLATRITSSGNPDMISPAVAQWVPLCTSWLEELFPVG